MRGRRDERGVALVIVLLVLVTLSVAGVGLLTATSRELLSVSRETSRQVSEVGATTGAGLAVGWFENEGFLAPPVRVNEASITVPTDEGYWNVRNYGGIDDSDAGTVGDWTGIAPDDVLQPIAPHPPVPAPAQVWFEIETLPRAAVFSNRVVGEEAGRSVRYSFEVSARARTSNEPGSVELQKHIRQTYTLSLYD